jgi:hypothetical protein
VRLGPESDTARRLVRTPIADTSSKLELRLYPRAIPHRLRLRWWQHPWCAPTQNEHEMLQRGSPVQAMASGCTSSRTLRNPMRGD